MAFFVGLGIGVYCLGLRCPVKSERSVTSADLDLRDSRELYSGEWRVKVRTLYRFCGILRILREISKRKVKKWKEDSIDGKVDFILECWGTEKDCLPATYKYSIHYTVY